MLIKTPEEIKKIKAGGKIIGRILSELAKMAKAGISTLEIDNRAEELILKAGGKPSFKGYSSSHYDPPFPTTICASLNHGLVHGIARHDIYLKDGDIFSIDIGMEYPVSVKSQKLEVESKRFEVENRGGRGWYTDTSITLSIGKIDPKIKELLRVTRQALEIGIKAVKPGKPISIIGKTIEQYVKKQGNYGIIRDLVGHGVGHEVHEEPRIPNYYDKNLDKFIMKPGMVLALEPMISLGDYNIITGPDGWTIEMADGSMCAHYEHTLAVTKGGCEVMTRRPLEKFERFY